MIAIFEDTNIRGQETAHQETATPTRRPESHDIQCLLERSPDRECHRGLRLLLQRQRRELATAARAVAQSYTSAPQERRGAREPPAWGNGGDGQTDSIDD